MAASSCIDPVIDPLGPPKAIGIETVFRKPASRFGRNRVRKGLYAKSFPHSLECGLWSATALADRLASAGRAEREHESHVSMRATDSSTAAEQP